MDYDRFVGLVQSRARFPSAGEAVRAIRATTARDRTLQELPPPAPERFSFSDFCLRVATRETCDLRDAVFQCALRDRNA